MEMSGLCSIIYNYIGRTPHGAGRLKEADKDIEVTKAIHALMFSLFQSQTLTKASNFNENSPNGAIWGSLASIKIWLYDCLLTEVCALESFSLGSRRRVCV